MRKTTISRILGVGYWIFFSLAFHCLSSDWPQLQCTPDRKGYTPDTVPPPYTTAWIYDFAPERVCSIVQPVITVDLLFVPTMNGNLYALDKKTGALKWKTEIGTELLASAGCFEDNVVVGCMDGTIRAFNAETGADAWRFESGLDTGFSSAPCLAEGRIFLGNRGGVFYALDLKSGERVWEFDARAPIINTAAYEAGRVFFGSEDMTLHCLDAASGKEQWRVENVPGQSMSEYWPVAHNGRVYIRPEQFRHARFDVEKMDVLRRPAGVEAHHYHPGVPWLHGHVLGDLETGRFLAYPYAWMNDQSGNDKSPQNKAIVNLILELSAGEEMPEEMTKAQREYLKYYRENPEQQRMFGYDAETGEKLPPVLHFHCRSMTGYDFPPCVDAQGRLVLGWKYPSGGYARIDPETGMAVNIMPGPSVFNLDESVACSLGGDRVFAFHYNESLGITINGIFDSESRRWVPYELSGRVEAWRKKGQRSDNCQYANHAASISDGMCYHIIYDQLAAWKTKGEEK